MVEAGDKAYTCLPLYHAYSLVCGALNVLTQGQHLGLNGSVKNWMRDLRLFCPEMILLVPMMMESLNLQHPSGTEAGRHAGGGKKGIEKGTKAGKNIICPAVLLCTMR